MNSGRKLSLLTCIAASTLALALTACGNNGSSTASTTPTFTTSALSGKYVFTVNGTDPSDGDYTVAGSFTADGSGNITAGAADYNLGSGIDANVSLKGTYTVGNGVALLTLTDAAGLNEGYIIPLAASGATTIMKANGTGSGTLYAPAATVFSPAGTYTFALKGEGFNTVTATGGFVAASGGTFASGTESYTDGAVLMTYPTITGFLYPVQSNGRGQAAIGGNNFSYYVASANQIVLLGLDDRALLQGTATKQ